MLRTLAQVVFYSVVFVVYSGYGSTHMVFVVCRIFVLEAVPVSLCWSGFDQGGFDGFANVVLVAVLVVLMVVVTLVQVVSIVL